ncbi:hypothetical protein BC830DRAFT_851236 [Chytriomyces sp. MP71]|nr:hypothetical protein BC830DRAFT_851236 [Chytriomyces sp. MP71]
MLVNLTAQEQGSALLDLVLSTATFYKGAAPTKQLRDRVALILAANPWLAGRFVRVNGRVALEVPDPDALDVSEYFHVVECPALDAGDPVPSVQRQVLALPSVRRVQKRARSIRDKSQLFSATVAVNSERTQFAAVLTLSHVLVDGHAFYAVHNMLGPTAPIARLDPLRSDAAFAEAVATVVPDLAVFLHWTCWLRLACTMLRDIVLGLVLRKRSSELGFQPRSTTRVFNPAWIAERKTLSPADAAFLSSVGVPTHVSSNDVVSSWFFTALGCNIAAIAVNLRQRAQGIASSQAGNMVGMMVWGNAKDVDTPAKVRAAIGRGSGHACRPLGADADAPLTSLPAWGTPLRWGVLSNWAGFYKDVLFGEGTELLYHLPVVAPPEFVPSNIGGGVLFAPREGVLALQTIGCGAVFAEKGVFLEGGLMPVVTEE